MPASVSIVMSDQLMPASVKTVMSAQLMPRSVRTVISAQLMPRSVRTVSWVAADPAAPIRLYAHHHSGQWEDFTDEQWATTQDFESVEVAIFNPQEELVPFQSGDTVKGWVKSTELVEIFAWTAQQS